MSLSDEILCSYFQIIWVQIWKHLVKTPPLLRVVILESPQIADVNDSNFITDTPPPIVQRS